MSFELNNETLVNKACEHFDLCAENGDLITYDKIESILQGRSFSYLTNKELEHILSFNVRKKITISDKIHVKYNSINPSDNINPVGKKSIYLKKSEDNKKLFVGAIVEFLPHARTKIKTRLKGKVKQIYKCHKDKFNEYVKIIVDGRVFNKRVDAIIVIDE